MNEKVEAYLQKKENERLAKENKEREDQIKERASFLIKEGLSIYDPNSMKNEAIDVTDEEYELIKKANESASDESINEPIPPILSMLAIDGVIIWIVGVIAGFIAGSEEFINHSTYYP